MPLRAPERLDAGNIRVGAEVDVDPLDVLGAIERIAARLAGPRCVRIRVDGVLRREAGLGRRGDDRPAERQVVAPARAANGRRGRHAGQRRGRWRRHGGCGGRRLPGDRRAVGTRVRLVLDADDVQIRSAGARHPSPRDLDPLAVEGRERPGPARTLELFDDRAGAVQQHGVREADTDAGRDDAGGLDGLLHRGGHRRIGRRGAGGRHGCQCCQDQPGCCGNGRHERYGMDETVESGHVALLSPSIGPFGPQ